MKNEDKTRVTVISKINSTLDLHEEEIDFIKSYVQNALNIAVHIVEMEREIKYEKNKKQWLDFSIYCRTGAFPEQ